MKINKTRQSNTLYTGVLPFYVVGVNPTKDELETILDTSIERDPSYSDTDREGNSRLRIDIWLKNDEYNITKNYPIWIVNTEVPQSASGKTQYMGSNGLATYAATPEDLANENFAKWIFPPFRSAYVGETDLYNFLIGYGKIDTRSKENVVVLSTPWVDLVGGDLKEIKAFLSTGEKVKLLLAMIPRDTDNGVVWNYDFYRKVILSETDSTRKLANTLKKDVENGYPYKGNYQNTFDVTEFDPTKAVPQEEMSEASPEDIARNLSL
jgi:hypothetical protein